MALCFRCGDEIPSWKPGNITTGYGELNGEKYCYDCCAITDRESMEKHDHIDLYLTSTEAPTEVTNWPGTLRFPVKRVNHGYHNLAKKQYTIYFRDHLHRLWIGKQYGDNTQICHCKLLKESE